MAPVPWVPAYGVTDGTVGGMGVGRLVFRMFGMFMGVTAPVPWVPAYAGTTVRGEGVLVGDDGSGGFRAVPWVPAYAGTTVRGEGVLVGDDGCGGSRAPPGFRIGVRKDGEVWVPAACRGTG